MTHASNDFRLLNELDHVRIDRLLSRNGHAGERLTELLEDADVVSPREVPADVVTMYTRVTVDDLVDGGQRTLTLCYPEDADASAGFVSVLSPIGTALLGRRLGEETQWTTPTGAVQRLRVAELLFQPEANGDYTR
ncbi:MAG: nucleoside diphosphate kinase regulator [Burkholderiaceae bacterium]|nr:nucleoside diphosphate kinase regulator [Burkholderiaceae bacterium]